MFEANQGQNRSRGRPSRSPRHVVGVDGVRVTGHPHVRGAAGDRIADFEERRWRRGADADVAVGRDEELRRPAKHEVDRAVERAARRHPRDVVDPIFVGGVVVALELGQRIGVVEEQHARIGERAAIHVLHRQPGEIAGVVVVAHVDPVKRCRRAQPDRPVGGLEDPGTADIRGVHVLGEKVRGARLHDVVADPARVGGGRARLRGAAAGARRQHVSRSRPAAERISVGRLQGIRNARELHPRLLAFTSSVEADAEPSWFASREEIERKTVGRRRSKQHVKTSVVTDDHILSLLPERSVTILFAINRQRDGFHWRNRQLIGRAESSAEPHHAWHRRT